ncbi:adhesion protein FadA [Gammaproteobacteria bacterium]|nr:adhesion protein FadA [Gammaproteobacteria bacterium]
MKDFIALILDLIKKYRELKLPGRRKFYLNSFIFAYPVYTLCTTLWMIPLLVVAVVLDLDPNDASSENLLLFITAFPPLLFSFLFFWWKLNKIINKEKQELKLQKDAIEAAKQKALKEKESLIKIKELLNELAFEDKTSFENCKRNWKNEYLKILNKIEQEQVELKNLGERHPAVINMLNTRGVDDLNQDLVFAELKTKLQI